MPKSLAEQMWLLDAPDESLADDDFDWRTEWKDMPEFVQEKQTPFATLIVRFETQQDLEDFAKLIGQRITRKTKSIWHPHKSHFGGLGSGLGWVLAPPEDTENERKD